MCHPLRASRHVSRLNHCRRGPIVCGWRRFFWPLLAVFLLGLCSGTYGSSSRLFERFFPAPAIELVPRIVRPVLPAIPVAPKVSVDDHNRGVHANNQGIDALNAGDFSLAVRLFEEACRLNPGAYGSWNNLLIALRREGRQHDRILEVGHRLMAMSPQDPQPASIIGTHLLDQVKDARKALPYLAEAWRRSQESVDIGIALASAYSRAGYPSSAIELLQRLVPRVLNDPYPFYMLGNLLLARKDFPAALRALRSGLAVDTEGFVHNAYIRARFYAGQLEGLRAVCEDALRRFPDIINRPTIERILFSLQPQRYSLVETVDVSIADPKVLQRLDFLVRLPPNLPGHQTVHLESAHFLFGARSVSAVAQPVNEKGHVRFVGVPEMLGPSFSLRLQYRIQVQPWFASQGQFQDAPPIDLETLRNDPAMDQSHPMLALLDAELRRRDGNFLQQAFLAVGKGLTYVENFEDHQLSWIFSNPDRCDCTEFSRLLIALCLKRGIPARMVTGFLVKQELIGKETSVGHAWCEIHFPGKGWIPVDPTLGRTMDWAYFGNLLSDQIVFDQEIPDGRSRISVDFTSTRADVQVKIGNRYLLTLDR